MTTLAFALPRTFKMAALVLASAALLACDDDVTGIDRDQDSVNATIVDLDQDSDVQGLGTTNGRGSSGEPRLGSRAAEDEDDLRRFVLPENADARRAFTTDLIRNNVPNDL